VAGKLGKQKASDGPHVSSEIECTITNDVCEGIMLARKYST
jgi:hypothetical protein